MSMVSMQVLQNLRATLEGDARDHVVIPKRLARQLLEDAISFQTTASAEKQALVAIVQEQIMQFACFWMADVCRDLAEKEKAAPSPDPLMTASKVFVEMSKQSTFPEFRA